MEFPFKSLPTLSRYLRYLVVSNNEVHFPTNEISNKFSVKKSCLSKRIPQKPIGKKYIELKGNLATLKF